VYGASGRAAKGVVFAVSNTSKGKEKKKKEKRKRRNTEVEEEEGKKKKKEHQRISRRKKECKCPSVFSMNTRTCDSVVTYGCIVEKKDVQAEDLGVSAQGKERQGIET
jgi:hypothetical protein